MTEFPEFALDRNLRPCVVTRELLRQVEKQLLAADQDLMQGMTSERQSDLVVLDAFGSETFRSATDIPTTGFPETTDAVRIVVDSRFRRVPNLDERSFKIKLAFRREYGNRLSIRIRGPQARERAIGLVDRIQQITESQIVDSWIFRRREWLINLCKIISVFGGLLWSIQTYSLIFDPDAGAATSGYWIWTAVTVTASLYLGVVHWFFPPCAFESSRWSRLQEWRNWAKFGFASLVVFEGVIAGLWSHISRLLGTGE